MYLRITKGKSKSYLVLVEGYRQDGKVKQRTICNLGPIDTEAEKSKAMALGAKILNSFGAAALIKGSELEEESRANWGACQILEKLWEDYHLHNFFEQALPKRKLSYNLQAAVQLLLAGRLCAPCSKLSLHNTQQTYSGFPALKLQDLYKSLDELDYYSDQLNLHLFQRQQQLSGKTVVTFFDVTTLYFESQKAKGIKDFGFSKDCKFNEVQVVLSLLVNQHGMPIACEVFQGNTYEGHTLVNCISRLKEKYGLDKAIIVADRGLYSNSNLNLINELGFEYIVGTRLRNSKKIIKDAVFNEDGYHYTKDKDEGSQFKYKMISNKLSDTHTENVVIAWSQKRAAKDCKDRQRLIKKAQDMVDNGKLGDQRGAKKYISITGQKEATINELKIELDAAWDGYYGISTNSSLSEQEIINSYHDLWQIEDSFRVMKSHFEIRPMFHFTDKRIKGHIMLNFIALIFERYLEHKIRKLCDDNATLSPRKIRNAILEMQRSTLIADGVKFYSYSSLSDLALIILKALDIKVPKSTKVS